MASKSTNLRSQLEDLNITRDELDQIGEALKKEEFRKLLNNYFEEVTNPENQKVYENEITQLEKERGVDVTFIHPAAGYVIKTSVDGKKKAFINICQNENIGKPVAKRETGGVRWSVPHSLAPPRDDLDKNKNFCIVYDVVFHPEAIRMANSNKPFKQLVNDTALNAIEDSYKVALDKKNLIYPKIPFKGLKRPTVIRKKSKCPPTPSEDSDQGIFDLPNYPYSEPPEEVEVKSSELPTNKDESPYTVPKYIIKQRSNIEMQDFTNSMTSKMNAAIPSALVVEIDLPLIKSAVDVNLDVSEKSLCLSSEKPAKYKLDVNLPYAVLEGEGSAKFDSRTKKLVVTLSVKRRHTTPNLQQLSREDSGVDSESRSTESSSDDELSKCDGDKPPVIVEVISGGENKQTIDESDETAYRTSIVEHFLSSDIAYSLPSYKCNNVDNLLAFTFHVKNVEPESVDHVFLERSCGVHLKFKSMGAGCFPSHYAFCVKFPGELSVDSDSLSIEVWDNNVIAQLRLIGCDSNSTLTDYLCGKSEEELEKKAFDLPVAVLKLSQESKLTWFSIPPIGVAKSLPTKTTKSGDQNLELFGDQPITYLRS
ncbi:protein kintoun-like [Nilaparvata lugens]|uniref:protein kintoun-like n=1 Tax=Nilaparvata lugens TaxID=108931 RepID=UPI00193E822D|nr:protein kintoun-like [Nilaparvata lugens]